MQKIKLVLSLPYSSKSEVQSISSQTTSLKSNDSHELLEDYVVHQDLHEPDTDHHQQTDTATTTTVTGIFLNESMIS